MNPFFLMALQSKVRRNVQIANLIEKGLRADSSVFRNGALLFRNDPIAFHIIEGGDLIIVGARSAVSREEGLYLDCAPEADPEAIPKEWDSPIQDGTTLTINQVYAALQDGTELEVE
jgi:hypothetical protein